MTAEPREDNTGTVPVAASAPWYADQTVTLYHGDAAAVLRGLPDASVDMVLTSPPYYGLRDYGHPGQLGLETAPEQYVARLVEVFTEVRRVLAGDGVAWLNLGDCYAANSDGWARGATFRERQPRVRPKARLALPPKNLLGIPWRVAFAMQDIGLIVRNAVVWAKPNAMPESVTDRLACRYEIVFLLARSRRYWFDLDAIREPLARPEAADGTLVFGGSNKGTRGGVDATARRRGGNTYGPTHQASPGTGKFDDDRARPPGSHRHTNLGATGAAHEAAHPAGRNAGDVWTIATSPYRGAHFAVFPPELARRCVLAGCRPGGVVLDPFCGSGTVGVATELTGRRFAGVDINDAYLHLALQRLRDRALPPLVQHLLDEERAT